MSESPIHLFNWFIQKSQFIKQQNKWVSLWVARWIIHYIDLPKSTDSFSNKTCDYLYECVIESFTQLTYSEMTPYEKSDYLSEQVNWFVKKHWIIQYRNTVCFLVC